MPQASAESIEKSDYAIIRPQRIGPRGLLPWFPILEPIYVGEETLEHLGLSIVSLVGLVDRRVRVTLMGGNEVGYFIPADPWADLPESFQGGLGLRQSMVFQGYLLELWSEAEGRTHSLRLRTDPWRNFPAWIGAEDSYNFPL